MFKAPFAALLILSGSVFAINADFATLFKSKLSLNDDNFKYSSVTNAVYYLSDEECGLVNCYRHKIGIKENKHQYYISVMSSYKAIPFQDRLERMDFGKRSAVKSKDAAKKVIESIDSSATVIFDDEKDSSIDYATQFARRKSYGSENELVVEGRAEPWFTYMSFDFILKNGWGTVPELDTIPAGGVAVLKDFYCGGLEKSKRRFDFFVVAPEFEKFRNVDTTLLHRPKVGMREMKLKTELCDSYNEYYVFLNSPVGDTSRLVVMGKDLKDGSQSLFDWRLIRKYTVFSNDANTEKK